MIDGSFLSKNVWNALAVVAPSNVLVALPATNAALVIREGDAFDVVTLSS